MSNVFMVWTGQVVALSLPSWLSLDRRLRHFQPHFSMLKAVILVIGPTKLQVLLHLFVMPRHLVVRYHLFDRFQVDFLLVNLPHCFRVLIFFIYAIFECLFGWFLGLPRVLLDIRKINGPDSIIALISNRLYRRLVSSTELIQAFSGNTTVLFLP